jgi:hypothetical protein
VVFIFGLKASWQGNAKEKNVRNGAKHRLDFIPSLSH